MLTSLPKEFYVPPKTEVIFVQDFFAKELVGGAELTSDAIIKACPKPLFELHAHSITESMIQKNKDKIWVFGNQTMTPPHLLQKFIDLKVRYYFFEYDFKTCVMRSTKKHEMQTGHCNCHNTPLGKFMANWITNARIIFWASDAQSEKFFNLFPYLRGLTKNFTQSSTFYPETILNIRKVRKRKEQGELEIQNRWLILDSDSWIKGTQDAVNYCNEHNMSYVLIKGLKNEQFLEELAKSKGLIFLPRDSDTCPRVVIEAKILGLEIVANENVQHFGEEWFNKSIPEIEEYLIDGPSRFWRVIEKSLQPLRD